jgi:hypothetical protein
MSEKDYSPGFYLDSPEAKQDRDILRPRLVAALAVLVMAGTAIWATKANAEPIPVHVHESENVIVRLMPVACSDHTSLMILAMQAPDHLHKAKAIESLWRHPDGAMHPYAGCWLEFSAEETGGEAGFLVVFQDGKGGFVTKKEFAKKPGQNGV